MKASLCLALIMYIVMLTYGKIEFKQYDLTNLNLEINATSCRNQENMCIFKETGFKIVEKICRKCSFEYQSLRNAFSETTEWRSSIIMPGDDTQHIDFKINFPVKYQIDYLEFTFNNNVRPRTLMIHFSRDNKTFIPWIQLNSKTEDILKYPKDGYYNWIRYKIKSSVPSITYQYYDYEQSRTTFTIEDGTFKIRAHANNIDARTIRIRLMDPVSIIDNGILLKSQHPDADKQRLYFAINNMKIRGKCICHGHASNCQEKNGKHVCECQKSVCGDNCEKCCPFYNESPWRPKLPCKICNCNKKSDKCVYNSLLSMSGASCIKCKENTWGKNCEKCSDKFYKPTFTDISSPNPCEPCNCTKPMHDGRCVADLHGKRKCLCRIGYKEEQNCTRCSDGYYKEDRNCIKCPCKYEHSAYKYKCFPPCNCKSLVDQSSNCTKCVKKAFNLQAQNINGCTKCFCNYRGIDCSISQKSEKFEDKSNWKISHLKSNNQKNSFINTRNSAGTPYIDTESVDAYLNNPIDYYFKAPTTYLGNRLSSIGSNWLIKIKTAIELNDMGSKISGNVINVECGNKIVYYNSDYEDTDVHNFAVPLKPRNWRCGKTNQHINQNDFSKCFGNISNIWIKASWFSKQKEVHLQNFEIYRIAPMSEKCECLKGYSGNNCEKCAPNYVYSYKLNKCILCMCNNYSQKCDNHTGDCLNCTDNRAGSRCGICKPGYFMSNGSCKICNCPLNNESYLHDCKETGENTYKCLNCTDNREGLHCKKCKAFHYVSNTGLCLPCKCNNNEVNCTSTECHCKKPWLGKTCDQCPSNMYIYDKKCNHCHCDKIGSSSKSCDKKTGRCSCKTNFHGRRCNLCKSGKYLEGETCKLCNCNEKGTITDSENKVFCLNGICQCKTCFTGKTCNSCVNNNYNFPNCTDCGCSNHSISPKRNHLTGKCECGPNVQGEKCETCKPRHYWFNRTHCVSCSCGIGSTSKDCDMKTGQCKCFKTVIGLKCNECRPRFYLSKKSCKKCRKCSNNKVCNDDNRPCQYCANNQYRNPTTKRCESCQCDSRGVSRCDSYSGLCICKSNVVGPKCNMCANNTLSFPHCFTCSCDIRGTKYCNSSGTCVCKENVEGRRCDTCKEGYFGLTKEYEGGCFKCICSNFTNNCKPANLVFVRNKSFPNKHNIDIKAHNGRSTSPKTVKLSPNVPDMNIEKNVNDELFVDITKYLRELDLTQFYGSDVLTAHFLCNNEIGNCGQNTSKEIEIKNSEAPFIIKYRAKVKTNINADVITLKFSPDKNSDDWYFVKRHGDKRQYEQPVRNSQTFTLDNWRSYMMYMLRNYTEIRIRLVPKYLNLTNVKVTIYVHSISEIRYRVKNSVTSVEKCLCKSSKVYGRSCEKTIGGVVTHAILLKGNSFKSIFKSEKCQCNGNSQTCVQPKLCTNCNNNTKGDQCELCLTGYNHLPKTHKCVPCQCPSIYFNNARQCNKKPNGLECKCRDNYDSSKCQNCVTGHYLLGNICTPCNCETLGSINTTCDKDTGQCHCIKGYIGQKCRKCDQNKLSKGTCFNCNKIKCSFILEKISHIHLVNNSWIETKKQSYKLIEFCDKVSNKTKMMLRSRNSLFLHIGFLRQIIHPNFLVDIQKRYKGLFSNPNITRTQDATFKIFRKQLSTLKRSIKNISQLWSHERLNEEIEKMKKSGCAAKNMTHRLEIFQNMNSYEMLLSKIGSDSNTTKSIMDQITKDYLSFTKTFYETIKSSEKINKIIKLDKDNANQLHKLRTETKKQLKSFKNKTKNYLAKISVFIESLKKKQKNSKKNVPLDAILAKQKAAVSEIKHFSDDALNLLNLRLANLIIPNHKLDQKYRNILSSVKNLKSSIRLVSMSNQGNKIYQINKPNYLKRQIPDFVIVDEGNVQKTLQENPKVFNGFKEKLLNLSQKVTLATKQMSFSKHKNHLSKIGNEIKNTKESYKLVFEFLKYMNKMYQLLNKIMNVIPNLELSHGSAASSIGPVRFYAKCIRQYSTYYLLKSYNFNLRFHFKPQFSLKSLILFGYDDSQTAVTIYALTMTHNSLMFSWVRNDSRSFEMVLENIEIMINKIYSFHFQLENTKIKMVLRDSNSVIKEIIKDISQIVEIYISSKSFIVIGGLPKNVSKKIKDTYFYKTLKANYEKSYYYGCLYNLFIQNRPVGLADFYSTNKECEYIKDLPDMNFSCQIDHFDIRGNYPHTETRINNLVRHGCCSFTGRGYYKIVPSQNKKCFTDFKKYKYIFIDSFGKYTPKSNFLMMYIEPKNDVGVVFLSHNESIKGIVRYRDILSDYTTFHLNESIPFNWYESFTRTLSQIRPDRKKSNPKEHFCHQKSYIYIRNVPYTDKEATNYLKNFRLDKIDMSYNGWISLQKGSNLNFMITRDVFYHSTDNVYQISQAQTSVFIPSSLVMNSNEKMICKNEYHNERYKTFTIMIQLEENLSENYESFIVIQFSDRRYYTIKLSNSSVVFDGIFNTSTLALYGKFIYIYHYYEHPHLHIKVNQITEYQVMYNLKPLFIESISLYRMKTSYYLYSFFVGQTKFNFPSHIMRNKEPPKELLPKAIIKEYNIIKKKQQIMKQVEDFRHCFQFEFNKYYYMFRTRNIYKHKCYDTYNNIIKLQYFIGQNANSTQYLPYMKLKPDFFLKTQTETKVKLRIRFWVDSTTKGILLTGGYQSAYHTIEIHSDKIQLMYNGVQIYKIKIISNLAMIKYSCVYYPSKYEITINEKTKIVWHNNYASKPELYFGLIPDYYAYLTGQEQMFTGCILGLERFDSYRNWIKWEFEQLKFVKDGYCKNNWI